MRWSAGRRMTPADAEQQVIDHIRPYCAEGKGYMAGSSIHFDRAFIWLQMPHLQKFLHYRQVDVSTLKTLIAAWMPDHPAANYQPQKTHRALDDLRDSVRELRHYRDLVIQPQVPAAEEEDPATESVD